MAWQRINLKQLKQGSALLGQLLGWNGSEYAPTTVDKTSLGLGSVNNTADVDKPVSIPQAAALALKADKADGIHTGATSIQALRLSGDVAAATVSADQHNYNPTGFSSNTILRLAADAAGRKITGFVAPAGADGDLRLLMNVGAYDITIANENAGSTAANRVTVVSGLGAPSDGDMALGPYGTLVLVYDNVAARWRVGGPPAATKFDVWAGTTAGKWVSPKVMADAEAFQTLTYGTTVAWNAATQGLNTKVVLGGNGALGAPSNCKVGWEYRQIVAQDATGGRTPSMPASTIDDWGPSGMPSFSTGALKEDLVIRLCMDATAPGKFKTRMIKAA